MELKLNDTDTSKNNILKHVPKGFYRGQIVETILKENADCTSPILITDTIVFSPHTPKGSGNEMEIFDNKKDDLMYFENEHNTVWYKFWARENCSLTFDIIPEDINDDYDFMLYKWDGGNFRSKILNKQIKPIRTCISRNDKKIKSMTGLSLNESADLFVHSGLGSSYVKYIQVQKGDCFYLLVDNVYDNGKGHTIRFHYKCHSPDEMYVGKLILWKKIHFESEEDQFVLGSEEGLNSLYQFMMDNPKIKIEIRGHVNSDGLSMNPSRHGGMQKLSDRRAKAIYNFLIKKGIDKERLTAVGYADTQKIIKLPKDKSEYNLNIRAEILILSLDYKKDLELKKKNKTKSN